MKLNYFLYGIAPILLLSPIANEVANADLVAGSRTIESRADQTVRITTGPLNGPPFNIPPGAEIGLSALGSFTFDWGAESNGVASITGFTASFTQTHPLLGPYILLATGEGPSPGFGGELTNIVDNGGDLVSADVSISTTFSLKFLGPGLGEPVLYTKDQATFTGSFVDGNGSLVFSSSDDLDAFLSTGDPANDPLAAVSFNRTVTAVPEPASAIVCAIGLTCLTVRRRRFANAKP